MRDEGLGRRDFLKRAVAGGAAAAAGLPTPAAAQATAAAPAPAATGYTFLNPEESAFVEALVDHMIPADEHTPKGTDVGVNTYIDRALAGSWGKGDRLYMQGPWKQGVPGQGYQLPLTPAELYRAGIAATNRHCVKTYGKPFDRIADKERQEVLVNLSGGKLPFDDGLPSQVFFAAVHQTVMEGMFADPVYGGNRNKAGWKMVGFPGVIAVHQQDIVNYRNKKYSAPPTGITDVS
jgi:gluconate 2-dehydrogenase gamma chain